MVSHRKPTLHDQAVELYARRDQGFLTRKGIGDTQIQWSATNKATFLLCAFALENAVKASLVKNIRHGSVTDTSIVKSVTTSLLR
jgi:hypothetical protein